MTYLIVIVITVIIVISIIIIIVSIIIISIIIIICVGTCRSSQPGKGMLLACDCRLQH